MGSATSAPSTPSKDYNVKYSSTPKTRKSSSYQNNWSETTETKWAQKKYHKHHRARESPFESSEFQERKNRSRRHHRLSTTSGLATASSSTINTALRKEHITRLSNEHIRPISPRPRVPSLHNLSALEQPSRISEGKSSSFPGHQYNQSLSPLPSPTSATESPLASPHNSSLISPSPSLSPNPSPSASPRISVNDGLKVDVVEGNDTDWQSQLQFHFSKVGSGRLSQTYASFSQQWAPSPTQRTRSGRKKKLASAISAAILPSSYQTSKYGSFLDNYEVERLAAPNASTLREIWTHYDSNNDHQLEPKELKEMAKDLINRILRHHGESVVGKQPDIATEDLEELIQAEKKYLLPGHRHQHRSESVRAMSIYLKQQLDINGDGKLKRKEFMRAFGMVCQYFFSDKERMKKKASEDSAAQCHCFW